MTNPWEEKVCKMAQTSLLLRKQFYCREWVFHKLQHCLQEKSSCSSAVNTPSLVMNSGNNPGAVSGKAAAWGVLLVGGPGSGKTALCTELLWPSSPTSLQRGLHHQALAFHFCKAQDSDTLCVGGFVRGLVSQICYSGLLQGYEDKLRDPDIQSRVQPGECERNPAEASKRSIFKPFIFVDDVKLVPKAQSPCFGDDDPAKKEPRFQEKPECQHELYKAHEWARAVIESDQEQGHVLKKTMMELEKQGLGAM
ncbi:ankyrin repeat domain-containing protein 50-like [Callospermophilus lateralis]|uniref:ankyrin repeat domain-containing protein 50-like n=1 Tax=Callospermophilus lateralis TaxID=76772 RepID=UPI004053DE75